MTDERQAQYQDALVSETYRDLASEESPQHLDRAILEQARTAARPRYARVRAWSRPLAWAATVALSIALVLHLTLTPEVPLAPGPSDAEELVPRDSDLLRQADDMARMRGAPQQRPGTALTPAAKALETEGEAVYCDVEARSTRSSWLECIEQLESEGRVAEAAAERRAFELAFPDE